MGNYVFVPWITIFSLLIHAQSGQRNIANDPTKVIGILEKIIKAARINDSSGGYVTRFKGEGYRLVKKQEIRFTISGWSKLPFQRNETIVFHDPEKTTLRRIINGENGWKKYSGFDWEEMSKSEIQKAKQELFEFEACRFVPLLTKKNVQVMLVGEEVDNKSTLLCLKVRSQGFFDFFMYFDSENYLLKKTKSKILNDDGSTSHVVQYVDDYKTLNGELIPTTSTCFLDGAKQSVRKVTELRNLEKTPLGLFGNPKTPVILSDYNKIRGIWSTVEVRKDGEEQLRYFPDKGGFVFARDFLLSTWGRKIRTVENYELRPERNPKEIICRPRDAESEPRFGIYCFEGAFLKICVGRSKNDMPRSFEAKRGSGHTLWILKKLK